MSYFGGWFNLCGLDFLGGVVFLGGGGGLFGGDNLFCVGQVFWGEVS